MIHLWLRAEQRANEARTGLMPSGARALLDLGFRITVEDSRQRAVPLASYAELGCETAKEGAWVDAPEDAIVFGLKELPSDGAPLRHRHIMFGHAYKGQPAGRVLLDRFKAGGGTLYDLEYLVDETGRRVAAFGYWAGYAGAAVALKAWLAQQDGGLCGPVTPYAASSDLHDDLAATLGAHRPTALIIGALGRVGTGASDLFTSLGLETTKWDMAETASGGPFPEVLAHDIFVNCILAQPGTPVFVPTEAMTSARRLSVIGDIACDPDSDFSPVKVYDRATDWAAPARRVHDTPPLDVTAIDNLPSLMPLESSEDYASQLLPSLRSLCDLERGVWARARAMFEAAIQNRP